MYVKYLHGRMPNTRQRPSAKANVVVSRRIHVKKIGVLWTGVGPMIQLKIVKASVVSRNMRVNQGHVCWIRRVPMLPKRHVKHSVEWDTIAETVNRVNVIE